MKVCAARRCSRPAKPRRNAKFCSDRCAHAEVQDRAIDRVRRRDLGFAGVDVQLEPGPMGCGGGAEMRELEG